MTPSNAGSWAVRCWRLASLAGALGVLVSAQATEPPPVRPIARLDLPRYLGTWHEWAKFPNRFQRDCARGTQAIYSALPGGRVRVLNSCQRADGSLLEVQGVAQRDTEGAAGGGAVGGAEGEGARLRVRFAPDWLDWLAWVWAPYWVVDLDPHYQLAAVSEPGRNYLWVLSRNPEFDPEAYAALLARLSAQGFDVGRLERTPAAQP